MNTTIQALVVATMIQVIAMFTMNAYLLDRTTDHASRLVQQHRTEVQQQFSDERQQMKSFVISTVEREVSKAVHNQTK
ncbi:H+/gluconate symporter-like permease [Pseudomonas lini]|uniref:hypothetical protein n=1 Tax=Pseudomonas lini TaxID=163011 RepID=UPI00278068A8|nr:hypothetical protein [Pseudomonas lini]MDQ0121543.1 H+/gluconate symporter-like permease [Pseudomonas lini]